MTSQGIDLAPESALDFELELLPSRRRTMRRTRYAEEQIIGILKQHQAGLGSKEFCHKHGISDATF
jgi:hypothetical protein